VPVVTDGLTRPLYVTHAGDDRLFIVEQPGLIRIIEDGVLLATPFFDIRDRVGSSSNEQGLLGLAFHPAYAEPGDPGQGVFFVDYTDKVGNTVVSQFSAMGDPDSNAADPTSEIVLLTQAQPYPNHNGGLLKFGPDNYLYIGLGDGGSAGDPINSGQRLDTWLGKILRIDVSKADGTYVIPPNNPFVGDEGALPEIWAYGVRNPWRFSFDQATGAMFMGDVGQNQWEEINYSPAGESGGNFGWKIMEAGHCYEAADCDQDGLVMPIFEYDHTQGCSVTGGYVYRGDRFPALRGNYFFADYCLGTIWRLAPDGNGRWAPAMLLDSELVISSFGEDVNGELYVTDHARGAIYRLELGE
jgi:glucose/arabinose dehydrogenase